MALNWINVFSLGTTNKFYKNGPKNKRLYYLSLTYRPIIIIRMAIKKPGIFLCLSWLLKIPTKFLVGINGIGEQRILKIEFELSLLTSIEFSQLEKKGTCVGDL